MEQVWAQSSNHGSLNIVWNNEPVVLLAGLLKGVGVWLLLLCPSQHYVRQDIHIYSSVADRTEELLTTVVCA